MNSLNNYLKSLISAAGISSLAIATVGNANTVNALPLGQLNPSTIQQLRQVISQNSQPPEVIIDTPNNSGSTPSRTAQNTDVRFRCELVNGEYTVMYYPESQPNQGYPWAIPSELGGGWTPERRCDAITQRFEEYRQEGLLELATSQENGYDTICVTTQLDPTDCKLILTVPPGQDPQLTRDLIFDNLLVADDGQQTQGVYTFGDSQGNRDVLGEVEQILGNGKQGNNNRRNSPESINLKPFLDPADGGTGQQLTQDNTVQPQPNNSNSERKPDLFK